MWARRILIPLTICLGFAGCAGGVIPSNLSDEQIDSFGMVLANWGQYNCRHVLIDDSQLTSEGPNAGGCSSVHWENPFAVQAGMSDVDQRRDAFRGIVEASRCDLDELEDIFAAINSETAPEDLTDDLACLGEVTFGEVEFGPE